MSWGGGERSGLESGCVLDQLCILAGARSAILRNGLGVCSLPEVRRTSCLFFYCLFWSFKCMTSGDSVGVRHALGMHRAAFASKVMDHSREAQGLSQRKTVKTSPVAICISSVVIGVFG